MYNLEPQPDLDMSNYVKWICLRQCPDLLDRVVIVHRPASVRYRKKLIPVHKINIVLINDARLV